MRDIFRWRCRSGLFPPGGGAGEIRLPKDVILIINHGREERNLMKSKGGRP